MQDDVGRPNQDLDRDRDATVVRQGTNHLSPITKTARTTATAAENCAEISCESGTLVGHARRDRGCDLQLVFLARAHKERRDGACASFFPV